MNALDLVERLKRRTRFADLLTRVDKAGQSHQNAAAIIRLNR
jgi:hypothetical protein